MSRSRLAPFGVAVLAVSISAAAFPIGNALIGDRDRQQSHLQAAPAAGSDDSSAAGAGRLTTATSCADLLNTLTTRAADLVGAWGWEYGPMQVGYWGRDAARLDGLLTNSTANLASAESQSSSQTGTNVQEVGVDEPDLAKTDGRILARIDGRTVRIFDLTADPQRPQELATLKLPGRRVDNAELLLRGDRLFVVGTAWQRSTVRTAAITVDLADPARPRVENTRWFDGDLLSARLTGDDLRVVTSSGLPDLDFVRPTKNRTRKEAKAQNKAVIAASRIEDWLPQFSVGSTRRNLVDCAQVNVPAQRSELGMLNVVGFRADAVDPAEISTTSVLTRSQIVYTSLDRLYLATGSFGWCCDMLVDSVWPSGPGRRGEPITTDLHAFALDGTETDYLASGEVDGQIQDRWAMDSADGVLRVATSISTEQGKKRARRAVRSHSVLTLGERGGRLVELGSVDGLGVDEEIQSVRWFDDSAYLVTFRQVDPLYAIDLRDPESPRLLGELKIPGFSSYLHPIGAGRLLGLGTDATARGRSLGAQASVFDVADPSRPKQVAKQRYGRTTDFGASWEPRQFTWLPEQQTALAALSDWRGASRMSIVAIEVADDGTFTSTEVPVTGGWRSYNVRTVPLPDGRVVVTSKATTAFLEW
ncbi:beta-propeller domain-containing protein [Nocardioides sp. Bht2]|uniref:beta-propeller domain-containing protein n=1 Tax=Nocardioides sp. Bht2 TaxID=3392297 RepID=UPI0039B658B5